MRPYRGPRVGNVCRVGSADALNRRDNDAELVLVGARVVLGDLGKEELGDGVLVWMLLVERRRSVCLVHVVGGEEGVEGYDRDFEAPDESG